MDFKKVSVVGLGYIGLPTAAMFAAHDKQVVGIDVSEKVVATINSGAIHIVEPGLDSIVKTAVSSKKLRASCVPEEADAFLIAVPTPFQADHQPDLSYIHSACLSIAPYLKKGDLIVLESTSPVGTTEKMADWLQTVRPDLAFPSSLKSDADVYLAHCPERVLPGSILKELVENDRVIGGITPECSNRAKKLYEIFVKGECVITNSRTAELVKLTENSFRDVNIALANELSIICDKLEINVWELIQLANRHPRVNILQPGAGVGGHCIAVDPWFIVAKTPDEAQLIRQSRIVNDEKPLWVVKKVEQAVSEWLLMNPDKTTNDIIIGCYGLAFKADIDDLRESPAVRIVNLMAKVFPGKIVVCEPYIEVLPQSVDQRIELVGFSEARNISDVEVILVGHTTFAQRFNEAEVSIVDPCGVLQRTVNQKQLAKVI